MAWRCVQSFDKQVTAGRRRAGKSGTCELPGVRSICLEGRAAIETFTNLTKEANRAVAPVHNRMPLILLPQNGSSPA